MTEIQVLLTEDFSDELLARLRAVSPQLAFHYQRKNLTEEIWQDVEVLYSSTSIFPDPGMAPKLRWVQLNQAGANKALAHSFSKRPEVMITTASGVHVTQMSEYCLMMMLAFSQNLLKMFRQQQRAEWGQQSWGQFVARPLRGTTLGIVGYGSIGRELARQATSVGMRVLASKRNPMQPAMRGKFSQAGLGDPEGELPERLYPPAAIADMAAECDYLVVALPLSAHTKSTIGKTFFSAMKQEAIFINIGRGGVVDEEALLDALQNGQIAGAALDVFTQEPLPSDSPFWQLENVIISPHTSGNSVFYSDFCVELFAENLRRYLDKLPLLNRISREKGY